MSLSVTPWVRGETGSALTTYFMKAAIGPKFEKHQIKQHVSPGPKSSENVCFQKTFHQIPYCVCFFLSAHIRKEKDEEKANKKKHTGCHVVFHRKIYLKEFKCILFISD